MTNVKLNFAIDLPYSFSIYRVNSIEKCTEFIGFTARVKRMIILPCKIVRNSAEFKRTVESQCFLARQFEISRIHVSYTKR